MSGRAPISPIAIPALITLVLLAASCGGTTVNELTVGPTPVRCELSFAPASASVTAAASQATANLTTTADCAWTAQSLASWMQVAPSSGQGAAALSLTIAANSQASARTGAVTVGGVQFSVTQAAATAPAPNCSFTLNPSSRSINDNGGSRSFNVSTSSGCAWTATTTAAWITFEASPSGSGSGRVDYRVARNTGRSDRVGTIRVGNQAHTVTQDGD